MSFYPAKINDLFLRPRCAGAIEFPSAVGNSGSFVCGAAARFFLRVENGKIVEAKFKAAGCGFLFAATEELCRKIENREFAEIGKAVRENENLFSADLNKEFAAHRAHCLELSQETLRAAINDYRAARLESWNGEEVLICTCFGVSETMIETAIRENSLTMVEEVTEFCRAGGGCGSCQPLILEILDDARLEQI